MPHSSISIILFCMAVPHFPILYRQRSTFAYSRLKIHLADQTLDTWQPQSQAAGRRITIHHRELSILDARSFITCDDQDTFRVTVFAVIENNLPTVSGLKNVASRFRDVSSDQSLFTS